ncbi:hypothetical protein Lalb_Chr07g0194111 [Lupinus albus]|uniref:Uncharacterized protein n=1 Tax=Lupinus albus TaxID=3870 RepID=A0A6A4QBF3_LUPAL|nr:hypothetical protein Lalb_Chr07g0194111 [Lupinus albus]
MGSQESFTHCSHNNHTLYCPLHPHPHPHRHHHHRHCPHCPLHHRHHSHSIFQSHLLPTPLPIPPTHVLHHHQPNTQISQELEHIELEDDEELDDEPVFVLTDEWREFFAKSEAKRKLEKKQNKKGKK